MAKAVEIAERCGMYNVARIIKTLVPAPVEAEGWVLGIKKHALWLKVFNKDEFRLIQWEDSWMLYTWLQKEDRNTGFVAKTDDVWMPPQEAQAWADALIAERDAGEKKPEPFEGMGNYRNQQPTSPDHVLVRRDCWICKAARDRQAALGVKEKP